MSGPFTRLAAGLSAAVLVWGAGLALERQRFGATDRVSVARIEAELAARFSAGADTLATAAAAVAADGALVRQAPRDVAAARRLFDTADRLLPAGPDRAAGITVYGASGEPLAWAGRVSDLPDERIAGPAALFVAPGALGPRLVHVEPVTDPERQAGRVGVVVAEQLLVDVRVTPSFTDTFELDTSLVPVSLRARLGETPDESPYAFVIPASDGQVLVEARVDPDDLADARRRWRGMTYGAVLLALAVTLLVSTLALVAGTWTTTGGAPPKAAAALIAAILAAWVIVRRAAPLLLPPPASTLPLDAPVGALAVAALVWLLIDLAERHRLIRTPLVRSTGGRAASVSLVAIAGAAGLLVLWRYERLLADIGGETATRLLDFSLYPLDLARLATSFGLILLHAAVVWSAALLLRAAVVAVRRPRSPWWTVALPWAAGAGVSLVILWRTADAVLPVPLLIAMATAGVCAAALSRPRGRVRRASQGARLVTFFVALVVPALSMYPTLYAQAAAARERLVAGEFAPQAVNLRDDLQERLRGALETIDSLPSLEAFITEPPDAEVQASDQAFSLWSRTDLAAFRLTSAVELYAVDGQLTSRFALNLPEYSSESTHVAAGCDWDLIDEVSPLGSSERHVLRASRAVCANGQRLGSVVVRAMLDYRTLPFISSESPYLESLGPGRNTQVPPLRDLEFVVYGWSRAPIQASGTSVWTLPDAVFDRMVAERTPLWETITRDDAAFHVHFRNDRGGIYALGYPAVTPFGHLVNLAELTTLSGLVFVMLLAGASLTTAVAPRSRGGGRVLLREIRSSFYRKLFIAFVASAVVPVIVLALATRAYFASELLAEIEEGAVQTAAVAQRLVEDYATFQEIGTGDRNVLDDQIMMVVARAIGQAVNLFEGEALQATSERDLFASGLLPARTPSEVYRAIVIDRMPMFVGEEAIGQSEYLLAAAPVRAGGREGIVTVPQTLRRQEIEAQIEELDRRVLFASVLFVLLGAGIGYWMAERIADPVKRLTRATRRIALGDLDARIAPTSSDELRRLVEDFNRMADDLQRQRVELERTQRLEAWAEMARQVAHDIKNPLTPIQLSAEHARRVNQDQGSPLSPVLDSCVDAILRQVTLLRELSAEFSSFASSPTARPEPTDLAVLLEEVIASYRTGLTGRIAIDVRVPNSLPQVPLDRTLFSRALTNIVENALHAMPGAGTLTIDAHTHDPSTVVVTITDTGIGMDPEARGRIFEPYFSTRATGTGLGLTIAKRNVELLGGTIGVESERGVGTTVTIRLQT